MKELTLIVPGLAEAIAGAATEVLTECIALAYLLGKGRRVDTTAVFHELLCAEFGLLRTEGQDLPIAALSALADDNHLPEGVWMRIDPIHLHAGMDGLVLQSFAEDNLSQHDAILLAAPLKELFNTHGWDLKIPVPTRWYLQLDRAPAIVTQAPCAVLGKNIRNLMPAGPGRGTWDRIVNEAQMLLHASELNHRREAQGQPALNSVWPWGCGTLPEILPRFWSRVYSDLPEVAGLAMLSATARGPLPQSALDLLASDVPDGKIMVALEHLPTAAMRRDNAGIEAVLQRLENDWIAPLLAAVETGDIARLRLLSEGRSFTYDYWSRLCFWRRPADLARLPHAKDH
ncbi:MAG: hypothetical protein EPO31_02110 [Gammaproteobacteria bacterium]|nr:MAG: hypothetical protein EPO31_02110 [Gammaproteobacteria bacterium]